MRKKSHVAVANYISNNLLDSTYKKSFCIGSILPDLMPSFITTKHEFFGTFEKVEAYINKLVISESQGCWYHIQLGQIIHYLADYFTLPHNNFYTGSIADHCIYEGELKFKLRRFLKDKKIDTTRMKHFISIDELISYIKEKYKEYSHALHKIETDCEYIFVLCCQVIYTITGFLGMKCEYAS